MASSLLLRSSPYVLKSCFFVTISIPLYFTNSSLSFCLGPFSSSSFFPPLKMMAFIYLLGLIFGSFGRCPWDWDKWFTCWHIWANWVFIIFRCVDMALSLVLSCSHIRQEPYLSLFEFEWNASSSSPSWTFEKEVMSQVGTYSQWALRLQTLHKFTHIFLPKWPTRGTIMRTSRL